MSSVWYNQLQFFMKEGFRKFKERLKKSETPGEKLHSRVKKLARMGSFKEAAGIFSAGFIVSPTVKIEAMFQPADNTSRFIRIEIGNPEGKGFEVANDFKIFPDGKVVRLGVGNMEEAEILFAGLREGDRKTRETLRDKLLAQRDIKSIMGISDRLNDVQIGELLGLVKSKTLRGIYR